jgi:hypothetical protein
MKDAVVPKELGNIRLGCLTLALLLAISGYLGYRIIPVYLEQDAFHDDLFSLAGRATRSSWDNRKIISQVMQLAESKNFQVERKDIRIQRVRGRSEVSLVVNYSRSEEFPGGYTYVFHFRCSATLGSYWF